MYKAKGTGKRATTSKKCDCKWRIWANCDDEGAVIGDFSEEHNLTHKHIVLPFQQTTSIQIVPLSDEEIKTVKILRGNPPAFVAHRIRLDRKSGEQVVDEVAKILGDIRKAVTAGDAQNLVKLLYDSKENNALFYSQLDTDDNGVFRRLFWMTPIQRALVRRFSDSQAERDV